MKEKLRHEYFHEKTAVLVSTLSVQFSLTHNYRVYKHEAPTIPDGEGRPYPGA